MKKTVTVEIKCCDFCHSDKTDCHQKCLGCGKDVCWECDEKFGVVYRHSVSCQGSGDGFYCHDCESKPEIRNTPLHLAFVAIANLRTERQERWEDHDKRCKAAEKNLEEIQKSLENSD